MVGAVYSGDHVLLRYNHECGCSDLRVTGSDFALNSFIPRSSAVSTQDSHYCVTETPTFKFQSLVNALTGTSYIYAGSCLYPELIQEMNDKHEFVGPRGSVALGERACLHLECTRLIFVLSPAYYVIVPLYVVCAIMGYWAYGSDCSANITENWSANATRAVALAMNVFMYCPLGVSLPTSHIPCSLQVYHWLSPVQPVAEQEVGHVHR